VSPLACTVCQHPDRATIDHEVVAKNRSNRRIAAQYGLSEQAVRRHVAAHLPQRLARARDARDLVESNDLLAQVQLLQRHALHVLALALQTSDLRLALSAIGTAARNIELLGRLLGELEAATTVNLVVHPQWIELKARLIDALGPFPLARQAVTAALLPVPTEVDHESRG
jgi:hypothetical protein